MIFYSKPGIQSWNKISPSARLLAENINPSAYKKVVFFSYGHGAAVSA
jgi:hypothetical protein